MAPEHQQMAKYGAFIAPPVLTAAFWTFPSALCYYWTCSNMYTIAMEIVLRHPGCAPLHKNQLSLCAEHCYQCCCFVITTWMTYLHVDVFTLHADGILHLRSIGCITELALLSIRSTQKHPWFWFVQ